MFESRPAVRWIAPVGALLLALAVGGAGTLLRASAAGPLPPRSAKQLLVDLQTADPGPFAGTVVQRADLGLPQLPSVRTGEGSSDLSSLVSGNHTLKVWYDGPQRARLALLGTLGESDIIRNGSDLWTWSSRTKSASHRTLPTVKGADAPPAAELPLTPQQAADKALAALDPSTKVTTDGSASVAGRDAYQLVLTPRDSGSLVGQIRLAVDAEKHIPLQLQAYAKGATEPAFQVGFTRVRFGAQSSDQFRFSPPPGTKVEDQSGDHATADKPGRRDAHSKPGPSKARTPAAAEPSIVGKGWTTVVVAKAPTPDATPNAAPNAKPNGKARGGADGELGMILRGLPRVQGSWGSGRLLSGSLFTVLVTDDGRILAGAVTPERLYSVAGTTR